MTFATNHAQQAEPSLVARASDVLAFEWTKLRSIRSNYITLIAVVAVTVGSTAVVAHALASAAAPLRGGPVGPLTASFLGYAEYAVIPVSVLAVLQFTAENTTGLIRTTYAAVPRRWTVLAGKAAVVGAVTLLTGELLALTCFALTQAILSRQHRGLSLADPGVPGAVLAGGVVLCACALTGLSLGAIIRHTAGGIAATIAAIYLLAALCLTLPAPWKDDIGRFTMPFATYQVLLVHQQPGLLSPAASILVVIAWPAVALLIAGLLITRRDA